MYCSGPHKSNASQWATPRYQQTQLRPVRLAVRFQCFYLLERMGSVL